MFCVSAKNVSKGKLPEKRPRKTKLTQNCRVRQLLTDNKMDNTRCGSVVLVRVEVQNPGQVSTCKCTPIRRRKITTKQYTPHPYMRRYRHVLAARMLRENHLPSGEKRSSVGKETVKAPLQGLCRLELANRTSAASDVRKRAQHKNRFVWSALPTKDHQPFATN